MELSSIKYNVVSSIMGSPTLTKVVNNFGNMMSKVTFGFYRTGLTRNALTLSTMVKPGDILKVEDNKVYKGKTFLMESSIFKGVGRKNIKVTEKMCTFNGMESSLKWDIIGERAKLYTITISLISKGSVVGAYGALCHNFLSYVESPGLAFIATLSAIYFSFFVVPYHRLLSLHVGSNDRNIMLSNVDGDKANIKTEKMDSAGGYVDIQGLLLTNSVHVSEGLSESERELTVLHEKAHLNNASEFSAARLENEKFFKVLMYEKQGLKNKLSYLSKNIWSLAGIFCDTFLHNSEAIAYARETKDTFRYHRRPISFNWK